MEKERIKKDLRTLRKLTHSIDAALTYKETRERRLNYLKCVKHSPGTVVVIKRLEKSIEGMNIEDSIKRAGDIEEMYLDAIDKLEPVEKAVIIEGYINGKAYWKIGREIGYTEAGVRKKINKAIDKLSRIL